MKVIIICNNHTACGEYRIFEPYQNLNSNIEFVNWKFVYEKDVNKIDADVIVLQRPIDEKYLSFIKDFNATGRITVIETDDDMSNIPFSNPNHNVSRDHSHIYHECLKEATYIHCSTPELALGNKYHVFHNAINLKKYIEPLKKQYQVLWYGSQTHSASLDLIKPAIIELLNDGVSVCLMSEKAWLEQMFEPHDNLTMLDLIPSVAPYIRFHEKSNGGNILVKKERTKNWLDAIYSLLDNQFLYDNLSSRSYMAVNETYNLEVVNKFRAQWWNNIEKQLSLAK